ncbi:MAG: hypothetical protein PVI30_22770 [Myxococcales bacterium]
MSDDLSTLEEIRKTFLKRFEEISTGYHALGEEVQRAYFASDAQQARPASAMTFRNFLQGKTTLRDPTGLLLYFQVLGATPGEMKRIRVALQQEVDRRLAAPSQQQALKAFQDNALATMPYSRAVAEAEAATRFERSTAAPIASVSPLQYLLGPAGKKEAGDDPRSWGLLQHMQALAEYLEQLELRLQDDFASLPPRATRKRRRAAAAGVREAANAYTAYLLARPEVVELLLSSRRYILHGPMPERERQAAIASVQRTTRALYHCFERFAQEVVMDGDRKQLCRTPDGEIALETVAERLIGINHTFYVSVVLGSTGTGAAFLATQKARREFAGESLRGEPTWSFSHERLVRSHEEALARANAMLEANARVRYGELRQVFDDQAAEARALYFAVWERDYAPRIVREAGTLLAAELHARTLLSDSAVVAFYKRLLTSREGKELQRAAYEEPMYEAPVA